MKKKGRYEEGRRRRESSKKGAVNVFVFGGCVCVCVWRIEQCRGEEENK